MDRKADSPPSSDNLHALLQLKTWEKPDPSFWENFDRELEKKKLQALVATGTRPKPSHRSWPWIRRGLGAATIFAIACVLLSPPGSDQAPELHASAGQVSDTTAVPFDLPEVTIEEVNLWEDMAALFEEWPPLVGSDLRAWSPEILFVVDKLTEWAVSGDQGSHFATELRQDRVEWTPQWDTDVALTTFSRSSGPNVETRPSAGRAQMSF